MITNFINPFINIYEKATETPDFNTTYKGIFNELLNKCIDIFEFKGFPETVNTRYFITSLLLTGDCCIYKKDNNWYAVKGTRGAEPNEYYLPTEYIIANPILGSDNIKISDENIQVFYWSSTDEILYINSCGIYPLLDRTARTLSDIYISTICALKNSRVVNIFTASTNSEKEALNRLITDMKQGKDSYTAIQSLTSKMQTNPVIENTEIYRILQEFVELQQFTLAQFYHAIAVNSNYNLKRAQINNEEIMTNSYILVVNLFDTEKTLKRCVDEFNKKSGLNVTFDYSDAWKKLQEIEENPMNENNLVTKIKGDDENADKEETDTTNNIN